MEWVTLVLSIIAIIISVVSLCYNIKENKRKYVFNQLLEIRNKIIENSEKFENKNMLIYLQNQLDNININNQEKVSNDIQAFCLAVAHYFNNIVLYLAMVKSTPNNVKYMQGCANNSKFLNNLYLLFIQEKDIDIIQNKYNSIMSGYIKQETFTNLYALKIKVVLEINNYLNDIIKNNITTNEAVKLLSNYN
ncbi:MAG: hypothetical protein J6T74_00645, partial [Clostridia bacterium]|nr:hypothetical protein [Clostridia bacterium]